MSDPDALLFDLDGCLVDSLPSIIRCWGETLPEFGLPVPAAEVIQANVGPPVDQAARAYAPGRDAEAISAIVAAYRARSARATDIQPFPGVLDLLAGLQDAGWTLGGATSKSEEVVTPTLARLGLTDRFQTVQATRVDELGTDKATIVGRAVAALAPTRTIAHVGDRDHDVVGAHAHGLIAIGVLWGYGSERELRRAGADALVAAPAELLGFLAHLTSGRTDDWTPRRHRPEPGSSRSL